MQSVVEQPVRPRLTGFLDYASWWAKKAPDVPITESMPITKSDDPAPAKEETPTPPEASDEQKVAIVLQPPRWSISIPTAFVLCFICFLLGSLFRSLLSPTDFVIIKSASDPAYMDEHAGWRRLTRLIEFKYLLRGNDLIVGIAHA